MSTFQLIDLTSNISFTFQFFPEAIRHSERMNWSPQDTTIGVRPLFYQNTEPRQMSVNDLILDTTDDDRSLVPDLDDLRALKAENETIGSPTPLLAVWGSQKLRCVLQSLDIEEVYFNRDGDPTRCRIMIELLELQDDGEATSTMVGDEDIPDSESTGGSTSLPHGGI
ncbi:MAG TPA: hypothetical protein PLR83_00140 [Pyrinomonadaceae bacterium]|nr:hypothetical protein [Pyrinomonadaceae bacterium]